METRYDTNTTAHHTAIWWTLGAIVVLFLLWFAFLHNSGNPVGVPNTGADNSAVNSASANTQNTGIAPNAKG